MEDLTQLKKNIAEFEELKNSIDKQQLKFPLDKRSTGVVQEDTIVPTGKITYPFSQFATSGGIEFIVNGKRYLGHTIGVIPQ